MRNKDHESITKDEIIGKLDTRMNYRNISSKILKNYFSVKKMRNVI